jgi:hypothetical protein
MHEAVPVVALGELDRLRGRRHRDAAALELRDNQPADLVDLLATPLLRPEADRANAGTARDVDDLEHAIAALESLVAFLALAQLVRALGPRGRLPAGALAVLAPRPAAGPAQPVFQLLLGPPNAALTGRRLLGILDPADELVAG